MRTSFLFPVALASAVVVVPGAARATSTTCSTSTVCSEYINTYTSNSPVTGGVAIHGESNGGVGIRGTSVANVGFYGASGAGTYTVPGVEGESTNNNGNDLAGGFGLGYLAKKPAPYIGVYSIGTLSGLFAETASPGTSATAMGYGVAGADLVSTPSTSGDFNAGVFGYTTYGAAVLAEAAGSPSVAGFGEPVGVYAVANAVSGTRMPGAAAFVGESNYAGLELVNTQIGGRLNVATRDDYFFGGPTGAPGSVGTFTIDYTGSETLSGTLTTSKGMYVRTKGSSGAAMREYGDRMTAPQVEDVGEAQLANGRAYVPIDARLADTIDRRTEYHVFVTPEGECNGLFVTQKSPAGFTVRELHGGRSSLAFEYRIVAKPVDENGTRLALMPGETRPADSASTHDAYAHANMRPMTPPLPLEAELRRRLGPHGYAKAIAALSARLAGR